MQTKQDLLDLVTRIDSHFPCAEWVAAQEGEAIKILCKLGSDKLEWLITVLSHLDASRVVKFASMVLSRVEDPNVWEKGANLFKLLKAHAAECTADGSESALEAAWEVTFLATDISLLALAERKGKDTEWGDVPEPTEQWFDLIGLLRME